jgi:hypothetical protein
VTIVTTSDPADAWRRFRVVYRRAYLSSMMVTIAFALFGVVCVRICLTTGHPVVALVLALITGWRAIRQLPRLWWRHRRLARRGPVAVTLSVTDDGLRVADRVVPWAKLTRVEDRDGYWTGYWHSIVRFDVSHTDADPHEVNEFRARLVERGLLDPAGVRI